MFYGSVLVCFVSLHISALLSSITLRPSLCMNLIMDHLVKGSSLVFLDHVGWFWSHNSYYYIVIKLIGVHWSSSLRVRFFLQIVLFNPIWLISHRGSSSNWSSSRFHSYVRLLLLSVLIGSGAFITQC